jgi:hypothetical protein
MGVDVSGGLGVKLGYGVAATKVAVALGVMEGVTVGVGVGCLAICTATNPPQ